jgi:hypothetical protein
MQYRPFSHHRQCSTRQLAANDGQGVDAYQGFIITVDRVKVWRIMIIVVHPDDNAKKTGIAQASCPIFQLI